MRDCDLSPAIQATADYSSDEVQVQRWSKANSLRVDRIYSGSRLGSQDTGNMRYTQTYSKMREA